MTMYQIFLLVVLLTWPFIIMGVLFAMSRLEKWVDRSEAETPEAAGIEPISGTTGDPEVTIVFGDKRVGERS
jgi:hypothetical protein